MAAFGDDARFEDVLQKEGDLGGVASSTPFKELKEVRLCNVGVVDRTLLPMELELGVLLRGLLGICICPKGEAARDEVPCVPGCNTIGEDGRGVAVAVLSESRLTLSEMDVPLLFVDKGIFRILDCSGTVGEFLLFSMAHMQLVVNCCCLQQHSLTVFQIFMMNAARERHAIELPSA